MLTRAKIQLELNTNSDLSIRPSLILTLVPGRFDNVRSDTLYQSSQSSTWKERSAAMLIHDYRSYLFIETVNV